MDDTKPSHHFTKALQLPLWSG